VIIDWDGVACVDSGRTLLKAKDPFVPVIQYRSYKKRLIWSQWKSSLDLGMSGSSLFDMLAACIYKVFWKL